MKQAIIVLLFLVAGLFIGTQIDLPKYLTTEKTQENSENIAPSSGNIQSAIPEVVNTSLPSVVTVSMQREETPGQVNPFNPFRQDSENLEQNIGSGFIVSEDGLIITNKHVVANTEAAYEVITTGEKEYAVEDIYRDPLNDLAIIKIDANGLNPLELGDSTQLDLGETVVAIGTPLGEFTNTVTSGIVSGLGRGINAGNPFQGYVERLDNVIQTDAAISPGNSGGPLLNTQARVVGVNTAIASSGQNIGFAIPSNVVKELLDTFKARGGSFERPFVGVRYQMVSKEAALANEIPEGAYIHEVVDGSPAVEAELQEGDIITKFNGKAVKDSQENNLTKLLTENKIGASVPITIWRDGQSLEKQLTIGNTSS